MGLKDYEEYRRALYGGITHKALLVDAVGTLVIPSQPMAQVGFASLSIYMQLSLSRICWVIYVGFGGSANFRICFSSIIFLTFLFCSFNYHFIDLLGY